MNDVAALLAGAAAARREGRVDDARRGFEQVLAVDPRHGPSLNALGLIQLEAGDLAGAITRLRSAAEADPKAPPIWINLAEAYRAAGRVDEELASLDHALSLDPYLLPALLKKAQAQERAGRRGAAIASYRALLAATPDAAQLPAALRNALEHGRALVRAEDDRRAAAFEAPLQAAIAEHRGADLHRARAYAEHRAGRRKVFVQQPVGSHFPYLPAIEYFSRDLFPWFADLEAATGAIRDELRAVWSADQAHQFHPYVAFGSGEPVNQWEELNHSPRWSAWFFWKDGVRQDDHCRRCPATAALLDALPLLDLPGKGPSVMFSVLAPRTRIPPHTGSSNVRTTVHLPLVVPDGCGFRVGAETRAWREGEAWAFDDTIEHEAWNNSDLPRVILILDTWNPLLTEAERAVVRAVG